MAAELAASRLVAPWFGSSTPVWAVLLSFVLLGLALGAELGGRLADRARTWSPLLSLLSAAAAILALLPRLSAPLLGDGDAFHGSLGRNYFYADGHVTTTAGSPLE